MTAQIISKNASFKDLTTLQIGGPIRELKVVQTQQDLIAAIRKYPAGGLPIFLLGGGSNLLVSDAGFPGIVIKNNSQGIAKNGNNLSVQGGTKLGDLVDFADKNGLAGLESLAGIPGTVGGAIYGNAGAYGQTISDHLSSVKAFDPLKYLDYTLSNEECQFDYRYSVFKKNKFVVLEAEFSLSEGNSKELQKISKETIKKREVKYPPGIKCPGSFFQNIPAEKLPSEILAKIPKEFILYNKVSAGALLESVGAKGARRGKILIAPYHANLFINEGEGKAEDFYDLAKEYQEKVYAKYGIKLEPEVQLINLPPLT